MLSSVRAADLPEAVTALDVLFLQAGLDSSEAPFDRLRHGPDDRLALGCEAHR